MKNINTGAVGRYFILACLVIMPFGWTDPGLAANERIGILLADDTMYFYQELTRGMTEEARALNMGLEIVVSRWDAEVQQTQAEKLLTEKMDAFIVFPCDPQRVGALISRVNQTGIPVFTVVSPNLSDQGKVTAHIGSDNRSGGWEAGRMLAQAVKGRGKVAIINHPRIQPALERVAGFREALREFPQIEIIADIPAWGLRERAREMTSDLITIMPELAGIFAVTDQLALGVADALAQARLTGTIPVVGYGGSNEIQQGVERGKFDGTVIQYPREMGRLAVRAVHRHLSGGKIPATMAVKIETYPR